LKPLEITSEPAAVGIDAVRTTANQASVVITTDQRPPVHHTARAARAQFPANASAPAIGIAIPLM
jgi:hypothetical protein